MSLDNDRSVVVERHPLDKESPFNSVFPRFVFFYGIPSHSCANRTLSLRIFHSSVSFLRAAKRRRRGQSAGILPTESYRAGVLGVGNDSRGAIFKCKEGSVGRVERFRISRTRYSEKKTSALFPKLSSPSESVLFLELTFRRGTV